MAIRTLQDGTRAERAFTYFEPAIGRVAYYVWPGGVVPAEGGARASNAPAPPIQDVIDWGQLFCAGIPNLWLRRVGKRVPRAAMQSTLYDGGIAAYWGTPVFNIGAGYFAGYMDGYDLETAQRWAYNDRAPVLCGWRYTGVQLALQGHVWILMPSGWGLQSTPGGGVHWFWPDGSYADQHSTVMVRGFNWINYPGDEF